MADRASLERHIYDAAAGALTALPAGERTDTYVVSFFVYDEDDDPRLPTLTVGTNSESQVARVLTPGDAATRGWPPSDPAEARWNYAFWLQNQLTVIGDSPSDAVGARLRDEWMRSEGAWLEEPPDDEGWEEFEARAAAITQAFVDVCVSVAQRLHDSGLIVELFGRPIPIVIHELEYDDEIADQTAAANPPALVDDFVAWVRGE